MRISLVILILGILFTTVSTLYSQSINNYVESGKEKLKSGDLEEAIDDFTKAIAKDPKCSEAYFGRGLTIQCLRDHDEAIRDFNKAIELNPRWAEPYYWRAVSKSLLGDYNGAIADNDRTIELDPTNASAFVNRGLEKMGQGHTEDGCLDFRLAREKVKELDLSEDERTMLISSIDLVMQQFCK